MSKKPHSPNFLTCPAVPEVAPPRKEKEIGVPPKKRRYGRWILVIFLLGILGVGVFPVVALSRAALAALSVKSSLANATEHLRELNIEAAALDIEQARLALNETHDVLKNIGFLRDVPGIGVQLRAVEDASVAGAETLEGVEDLLSVFKVITDALQAGTGVSSQLGTGVAPTRNFNDLSKEEKQTVLRRFSEMLPNLRLARDKVDLALELWKRVPEERVIAPLRSVLSPLSETLPVLKRTLDEAVPMIEMAVPLAGYPKPIRYLVLLQNADELRPAGGFIGTVGTMTFDAGDLAEFEFNDIYNIDNPASYAWKEVPPKPLSERLGVKQWYMRDANWSPDFPTSAERLLDFYRREIELGTGKPLATPPDAVLALEPGFFRALLTLTGPITVDGQVFDASNFFDKLEYEVEEGFLKEGIPLEHRKDLIQHIGAALVERLKALPASRWNEIVDLVTRSFERKQIMLFARNPEILSLLDEREWTGRAKGTDGDVVWVVDANLAALKTDGVMNKQVTYTLDAKDPEQATAIVTLTYTNTNRTSDWRYTRYRSYTRVYVPEGSQLISATGAMKDDLYRTGGVFVPGPVDVTKELGKTVFGASWSIEPGRTGTLSFTYKLPPRVFDALVSERYQLDWPKQAGADHTQLTLHLNFGTTLQAAIPAEDQSQWGDARYEYQTDSLEDRTFELKFNKK